MKRKAAAGSPQSRSPGDRAFLPVLQVNIIPIIAKADTISKSELHKFKIKIMSELVSNGVQIYQFPTDDEAVAEINSVMNVSGAAGGFASRRPYKLNCRTRSAFEGQVPLGLSRR